MSEELCSLTPSSGCEQHGRYYFRTDGLSFGYRALQIPLIPENTDLLVIDEVGRFELTGAIWADCIDSLVRKPCPPMVWTVRRSLVRAVMQRWPIIRPVILEIGTIRHPEVICDILEDIMIYRSCF
jgi:nucleoside-triphosphatase